MADDVCPDLKNTLARGGKPVNGTPAELINNVILPKETT